MKVYAEVLPPTLGRVMHRINRELKKHAPPNVSFVADPRVADLQVLDVLGTGSPPNVRVSEFALLQHIFSTTETQSADYWLPLWRRARVVMSSLDLPKLVDGADFAFYRAPYGVDGTVFRDHGLARNYAVMTSGYDPGQEAIRECYDAARRHNMQTLHLGPDFHYGAGFNSIVGVTDEQLARNYSACRYVSGLRRFEGFELPVLEGLACGARPICFDTAGYRYWFNDHAVYVPETSASELTDALARVFAESPTPVTEGERQRVIEYFSWSRIFGEFWSRVLAPSG